MSGVETLRFLLGDQLSRDLSSLQDLDPARDVILMTEVAEETTYVPHHPKKIALILSAMRHFAAELAAEGVTVDYVRLDDSDNAGSFGAELRRAVARHRPRRVVVCEPGEYRVWEAMQGWSEDLGLAVEIRDDDRFLCSRRDFADWAGERKQMRMEHFYRWMRRRSGLLMEGERPKGGEWNFDKENRKRLPAGLEPPPPPAVAPDAITAEVLDLVGRRFGDHFGRLEGFGFAVTRSDALALLRDFVETALPRFGDYQDAMKQDAAVLFHAVISPYLNIGLLDPREVCEAVEAAYDAGRVPINAAEGFIRQILGWREYVRGIYWLKMPGYAETNALAAERPLPAFYWTAETEMNCLRQCLGQTRDLAYAHHIQRLMVTGNFALLLGVRPKEVCEWYLAVYADAFEWVELPNTHGMAIHADGGILGSKPYAASGKYIDRMSDYCRNCAYDVKTTTEANSCPFNALYWNFLIEQEARIGGNPRMAMPYRNLARMAPAKRQAIRDRALQIIDQLCA
ncbi:MAG: cryptochrome/photolyase family protein [Kiloniellales bacterium]|nr:cryptochrome/photolyase family protein [Kiloniellales bacterium]